MSGAWFSSHEGLNVFYLPRHIFAFTLIITIILQLDSRIVSLQLELNVSTQWPCDKYTLLLLVYKKINVRCYFIIFSVLYSGNPNKKYFFIIFIHYVKRGIRPSSSMLAQSW